LDGSIYFIPISVPVLGAKLFVHTDGDVSEISGEISPSLGVHGVFINIIPVDVLQLVGDGSSLSN